MRWMLLIVSLICFVFGSLEKHRNPMLPSQPVEVTVTEAVPKLDVWKTYVSLSANMDLESRVYSTDVIRPVYSLKSTNEVHPVSIADKEGRLALKDYLGTTVKVSSKIASGGIQMQMIENEVGVDKVISQRRLSPLAGSNGGVWVLTNRRQGDEGDSSLSGVAVFEGVLTRFVDFDINLESYIENYTLEEIQQQLLDEGKFEITDETYLIILGLENTRDNLFYCPIKGSDNKLYTVMTEKLAADPPNPIVGIMESRDSKEEGDLGTLLNKTPPEKIGVIRHGWTADMYNKKSSDSVKGTFLFAAIFLFFALIGFARNLSKPKS